MRARPARITILAGLVPAALMAIAASCTSRDPVADLAELPSQLASKLQIVPGRAMLATKLWAKAPPPTQPPPPCAPDSTSAYYDARITTPITVCTNLNWSETELFDKALMPAGASVTHCKLNSASDASGLQVTGLHFPIFCSTSNGPWSAQLESDRLCVGTCSPQNTLTVTGIPNTVVFFWGGQFNAPPLGANFNFVGSPVKIDFIDWGRCHSK